MQRLTKTMKALILGTFAVSACFAQGLRLSDSLESSPPLVFPALMRIARLEGYAQIIAQIKSGQVISVEAQSDGHSPFKQSAAAISFSKNLVKGMKFKESVNGYIKIHFFYRQGLPLPPGSIPTTKTTIDWESNSITFESASVLLEIQSPNP